MGQRPCYMTLFGTLALATVALVVYNLASFPDTRRRSQSSRPRRMRIIELMGVPHDEMKKPDHEKQIQVGDTSNIIPAGVADNGDKDLTKRTGIHEEQRATTRGSDGVVPAGPNKDEGAVNTVLRPEEPIILPNTGRPRIFCLLLTTLANWRSRAQAVKDTWAKRCDVYRFFYSPHGGASLPAAEAVALQVPDGRDHLTAKTVHALRFAYENYASSIDWFFKADDDTYVIMENLRFVAAQFVPSQAHYIGGRSMDLLKHGYNGGGAGYLLSREAARLVVQEGPKHPRECKQDGGVEDLDIGSCLQFFKVYPVDTLDSGGRLTFHPDHPYKIWAREGDNARVYTYSLNNASHGNPKGIRTMSSHTVSFHYVKPAFMYMYDFLLYHLVRHDETGKTSESRR